MRDWISVENRLPELYTNVFVKDSANKVPFVAFRYEGVTSDVTLEIDWIPHPYVNNFIENITHWMPLPQPPKEKI